MPRLVLDGIVEAAGRLGMNDRAFATFQEYRTLFGVTPDIHSYNSLLAACVHTSPAQPRINMDVIFSVFQEIETAASAANVEAASRESSSFGAVGCGMSKPNSRSFSLLIDAMVECKEFRVFGQILEHMQASGVTASARSLRRAATALAREGHWDQVDVVKALISEQWTVPAPLHVQNTLQTAMRGGYVDNSNNGKNNSKNVSKQQQLKKGAAKDASAAVVGEKVAPTQAVALTALPSYLEQRLDAIKKEQQQEVQQRDTI